MNKQTDQMKWVLFWVFLILFILMVLGTLAMVFFGFGTPTESERELMVKGLIGEVAACIIALFYSIFGLKSSASSDSEIMSLKSKVEELSANAEILDSISRVTTPHQGDSDKNSTSYSLSDFEVIIDRFNVEAPFPQDEFNLKPLPSDIKKDIRSAKPFDVEHRQNSYAGMKVQWKVLFSSILDSEEKRYRIYADADSTLLSINFLIDKSDGQRFSTLDSNTPFWVCGEILETDTMTIKLENVSVKFEDMN